MGYTKGETLQKHPRAKCAEKNWFFLGVYKGENPSKRGQNEAKSSRIFEKK